MTNVAIVQARTSSSRLPGKVLLPLMGVPMILFQLNRLSDCKLIDSLILATSTDSTDDVLASEVANSGFQVFRGDLDDVLSRYYHCALQESASTIVRITGDCPFTDPVLVDEMIRSFDSSGLDYLSNSADENNLSVPDGFDIEVFNVKALEKAYLLAHLPSDREHVTSWMRKSESGISWSHYRHETVRHFYRVTVDNPDDYTVVHKIASKLYPINNNFSVDDVVRLLDEDSSISKLNSSVQRNEGFLDSLQKDTLLATNSLPNCDTGPTLWNKAKKIIPGGNMLLSKRPEMFLPDKWPAYFSRAKGCNVWDLDGRKFVDMSIMGIGTNLLGYGHPQVDDAVSATISSGNMSTLNCPEEVLLAERLISLHPWADMARFARSGGEANAIAIRIARAATGREVVAICGYHGWHDWYLATNLQNESGLEEHLLPGLQPNGVPSSLAGTVQPFTFNKLDQLENISEKYDLAAVKMEVQRTTPPHPGFLEGVRDLCDKKGIVLIFDECTSGFRETFGGLHLKYGVEPDMAMFGKALGNGYAITATIGRQSVMEAAQTTFISSTFWTERIGPSAALASLNVMEKEESWTKVTDIGNRLRLCWNDLASKYGLKISLSGIPSLSAFSFVSEYSLEYKTLLAQEMLKKGFLASTSCYTSLSHSDEIIESYLESLDSVFSLISDCENGRDVFSLLEGPVCHNGFKRLN